MAATNDLMSHLFGGQDPVHYTPGPNGELPTDGGATTDDPMYLFGYSSGGDWKISPWYKPTPQPDGTILYSSGSRGGVEYLFNPRTGKWKMRQSGVMNSQWTDTDQPGWYVDSDYPDSESLYPVAPTLGLPNEGESIADWITRTFPEQYTYYNNLGNSLLDYGTQGQINAMDLFNTRQQEASNTINDAINSIKGTNSQAAAGYDAINQMLSGARNSALSTMDTGNQALAGYLGAATDLTNLATSANPLKYLKMMEKGEVTNDIDSQLRAIRDSNISAAVKPINQSAADAAKAAYRRNSVLGLAGSDLESEALRKIQNSKNSAVNDAVQAATTEYSKNRLAYPQTLVNAAINTMQSYSPYVSSLINSGQAAANNANTFGNSIFSTAANQANINQNSLQSLLDSAYKSANVQLTGADQLMQYPYAYYKMATELPANANTAKNNYLTQMLNVWEALMNNQTALAKINAEDEGGSWLDWFI